jgi:hypothetical protein
VQAYGKEAIELYEQAVKLRYWQVDNS